MFTNLAIYLGGPRFYKTPIKVKKKFHRTASSKLIVKNDAAAFGRSFGIGRDPPAEKNHGGVKGTLGLSTTVYHGKTGISPKWRYHRKTIGKPWENYRKTHSKLTRNS